MRAGRTIISRIRRIRKAAGQAPASSVVAGLACLLGVLWLSAAPALPAAGCGILPHDHLLLSGAGPRELAEHLAEEAACAAGHAHTHADAHPQGKVISVFRAAPEPAGSVFSQDQVALAVPLLLIACGLRAVFVWRLPASSPRDRWLIPPPVDPPPEPSA